MGIETRAQPRFCKVTQFWLGDSRRRLKNGRTAVGEAKGGGRGREEKGEKGGKKNAKSKRRKHREIRFLEIHAGQFDDATLTARRSYDLSDIFSRIVRCNRVIEWHIDGHKTVAGKICT